MAFKLAKSLARASIYFVYFARSDFIYLQVLPNEKNIYSEELVARTNEAIQP